MTRPASPSLNGGLHVCRAVGRVANLEDKLEQFGGYHGTVGLAHTRWATHGGVTEKNAHPHRDDKSGICLVHNGIIENYSVLKTYLQEKGHTFTSETDTEVLAMLIGELYAPSEGIDLEKAVQAALREVTGAYAIAVICEQEPDVLVCARKGSPLIVGIGNGEYIVASDASAIVAHTTPGHAPRRLQRRPHHPRRLPLHHHPQRRNVSPKVMQLELDLEQIELGRLRALHAEGDLRAARGSPQHLPRPHRRWTRARSSSAASPPTPRNSSAPSASSSSVRAPPSTPP
jgi:glucosamine--fructose-6-phosphate aminotransferase (isomerizing)